MIPIEDKARAKSRFADSRRYVTIATRFRERHDLHQGALANHGCVRHAHHVFERPEYVFAWNWRRRDERHGPLDAGIDDDVQAKRIGEDRLGYGLNVGVLEIDIDTVALRAEKSISSFSDSVPAVLPGFAGDSVVRGPAWR